jgi:hypothetical protein
VEPDRAGDGQQARVQARDRASERRVRHRGTRFSREQAADAGRAHVDTRATWDAQRRGARPFQVNHKEKETRMQCMRPFATSGPPGQLFSCA